MNRFIIQDYDTSAHETNTISIIKYNDILHHLNYNHVTTIRDNTLQSVLLL